MANFTTQAIKASFIKLLNERPLNKITVKDITEDCGVNRNTFYYHYEDIPSLIKEIIKEETEEIINQYPSITSLDQCLEAGFKLGKDNRRAMMHLYQSANHDIYTTNTMKVCEDVVQKYIATAFSNEPIAEDDHRIMVRYIKCTLYGMIIDWMNSGMIEESIEDLKRVIHLTEGFPELIMHRSRELQK